MNALSNLKVKVFVTALICCIFYFNGNSQGDIQVEIIGGQRVYEYDIISITAGNALSFRIRNVITGGGKCANLKVQDITLDPSTGFALSHENLPKNIKPEACSNGDKYTDFTITNVNGGCANSTLVTIALNGNNGDFTFEFTLEGSPEINVLGGSPFADISHGSTVTSATNGTYFGVVEEGASVTRNFIVASTGSCPLDVTSITSSLSDFTVAPYVLLPDYTPTALTQSINPGSYIIFIITFTAPITDPQTTGTLTSTISISNSDNTTFTFDVSAEMFDFNIPGPGGITADFRLWLKASRGITKDGSSKVSNWADVGTNSKDASADSGKEPTYIDDASNNINFNPVLQFENDGGSNEQFMYNSSNGFYSQDIFIVMVPDTAMTSASSRNTIFAGTDSGNAGDMTGVGFGDYSSEFTDETLSYQQDVPGGGSFNGEAEISSSYATAGIINIRNNSDTTPTGQEILYNSSILTTSSVSDVAFENVGSIDTIPEPDVTLGTPYWIGKNYDVAGSLNGRVAEIFTFAERVPDADRQKIESYLAIKYGITLGSSNEAQKDYINSFGTSVWDVSANTGFNYHVAGIGRDSISDLNQKQSKTLNTTNEVTIGLNGLFSTNSSNVNEFNKDGDFLVWGSNNGAYSGTSTNTVTVATGITTSLTRIDRVWKIVETVEDISGDVENVYVSIPSAAFSSFTLGADEEYALIVADNANFANNHIIDVIPLKSDGNGNLQTWYDFDGTLYFTFGKAPKLQENHSVMIGSDDYMVGESNLNLNINAFTISAWVKADASQMTTRTIMSKGDKLQLRLNSAHQIEVMMDDAVTPRFTSSMALTDNKWHQLTFVYNSGTIFIYVDGVLDKSEQNVVAPSPNYNQFSLGALYIDKNTIQNPFLGRIDEIYVWDQALTEQQVRYLMNQEIETVDLSGTDYVNGTILPQAAVSNEVASIEWSKLKAYYNFNSFCGSTAEGFSDNNNFLRIKYLTKDKLVVASQTTPLPYQSASDGAWDSESTWMNGSEIMLPNALSLDGETYIDWNIVETSHDITSGDRNIALLGLVNTSGTITIADPNEAQDETNSGQSLTISHYLELDGVIDLVGESQLIQSEGSIVDADSGGYLERDQQGTANSYNYNYWSSSVGPISGSSSTRGTGEEYVNTNYTISGILNDGTTSATYQSINFDSSTTAADAETPSSPVTISTRWLYKFYGAADDYNAWTKITETSALLPGEGFTMKGTSGSIDISTLQNYVFKGVPNNGDIALQLDKSSGDVQRLIGNPYPSAIDANEFILDHIKSTDTINGETGRNTVNVFNGVLYFWHHFGDTDSHYLSDYVGGYATYTLMGGTEAYSTDDRIDNSTPLVGGGKVPERYIPVNQGFFVSTVLPSGVSGSTTTVDGGTITFKNSQRVYETEGVTGINEGSLFFKGTNKKQKVETASRPDDKRSRIRLECSFPSQFRRELLIGVDTHATDGFNLGYDAPMIDVNPDDMYWILENSPFVIQGVSGFETDKDFPIGITVRKEGEIAVGIKGTENLDPNFEIYIYDHVAKASYRINDAPFKVFLEAGTYDERFSLVFRARGKRINKKEHTFGMEMAYKVQDGWLHVKKVTPDYTIETLELYNLDGRKVGSVKHTGSESESSAIFANKGIYILHVKTDKGTVRRKIVLE
ncbi:LamG-like jellyroll fold domain-containing protein [Aestuariivivens sediminicola]|uniref:LamG-like jellyroll fold domain-containing protein n=1 Tax=Aestuariivivens sediminicola TaxID=2913560 RepID=UPI001F57824B|nr:LamG-like jellyroll fold domain-containing protein [Aestuariivivens sediminicola]